MRCPFCANEDTQVKDSRPTDDNAAIRRRRQCPNSVIGQIVMDALSSLDQVAYVRFASVYRNFREAKDFEEFVGKLSSEAG